MFVQTDREPGSLYSGGERATTTQPHRVFSAIVTRPGRSTRVILRTQSGLLQLFVCWLFTICSSFSDFSNTDVLRVQNAVQLMVQRQTDPASQNQQSEHLNLLSLGQKAALKHTTESN